MIADYQVPQEFIAERSVMNGKFSQKRSKLAEPTALSEVSTLSDDMECLRRSLADSGDSLTRFKKSLVASDKDLLLKQIAELKK